MFIWVANFRGLIAGFVHLPIVSQTYIAGHICLTENKIWVFYLVGGGGGGGGGICPILLHPNTQNLLLLFYAPVSLNFGPFPREWNVVFHYRIEIFVGYMWLVRFQLLNAPLDMMG